MFRGPELRASLEKRTLDAVNAVQSLEIGAWQDGSPAPAIASKYDVALPGVDWDKGQVQIGTTPDQRMCAVWSWTVTGDAGLLNMRPSTELIGGPSADVGLTGRSVVSTTSDYTLSAAQIDRAAADARHYVARYLGFISDQVARWRISHQAKVRDAGTARFALLLGVETLEETYL